MVISNTASPAAIAAAPSPWPTTAPDPSPGGVDFFGGVAPAPLTPDAVVAMLFQQLSATDSQIQDRVEEMTGSLKQAEALSSEIADLKALTAQLASRRLDEQKLKPSDLVTMPGGEETTVATVLERSGVGYLAGNSEITRSALEAAVDSKTTELSRHNSGKEQSLIQMQSNLQSRQQLITMATQLLNAIHQPLNQIANNLGR